MAARQAVSLAITILIVMLAAGCGEDSSGSGGGNGNAGGETQPRGVSLSRPAFLKEASEGCREARSGLEAEASRFMAAQSNEKPQPVVYASLAHLVLLPVIEQEMESIRLLGVPPSEEERIDAILYKGELAVTTVVFQQRIASIDAVYREFADVRRRFHAYGLPACVSTPRVSDIRGG